MTIDSGLKSLDSKHTNFHQDLERFVVGLIRDCHIATCGQIFDLDLDSKLEKTPRPIEIDSKLNLPLDINKHTIEPDWITYEWEVPEVIGLRCCQGEQQISLAKTLRTTIVLIGYDFHFEATTCEEYLKKEWGNLGIGLLELIISGIGDSPKSHSEYSRATYTTQS